MLGRGAAAPRLEMSLADVAMLAGVQRPVVSMWRSRSRGSAHPFPAPVRVAADRPLFAAEDIVGWLRATGRGNNPNAAEDVAAFAAWADLPAADRRTVFDGVTALLCLTRLAGAPLGDVGADALLDLADEHDPDDEFLYREVEALGDRLEAAARYSDLFADAAYNPQAAFERLMGDRHRWPLEEQAATAVDDRAARLVAHLGLALLADYQSDGSWVVDPTPGGSDVVVELTRLRDDADPIPVAVSPEDGRASRLARRRLRAHDVPLTLLAADDDAVIGGPAVILGAYPPPGRPEMTDEEVLSAVDDFAVRMDDTQCAVVLAPASALCDEPGSDAAAGIRDDLLRLGRVRAIVRLPAGLAIARPRQALALWVLGRDYSDVRRADRWVTVADLSNSVLDRSVIGDLVSDVVAAMGGAAAVRAHAFRFGRMVFTRVLLAARGSLVEAAPAGRSTGPADSSAATARLSALLDQVDLDRQSLRLRQPVDLAVRPHAVALGRAADTGDVRVVSGARVDPTSAADGLPAIGPPELVGEAPVGSRTVDRLAFTAAYGVGRTTQPGDVVFCTSPRVAAFVDTEGGSAIVYPAKALRVADSADLAPRIVAQDINRLPPHARQWRAWPLRRVPRDQAAALEKALDALQRQRAEAAAQIAMLDEFADLLAHGVVGGSLTLTEGQ